MEQSTTPTEVQDLDTALSSFEQILTSNEGKRGQLWLAWHYLQVYSAWSLRLPNTPEKLRLRLQIDNPGDYDFFQIMLESYQDVYSSADFFQSEVFTAMVEMGNKLNNFAHSASNGDGAIFSAITDLIDAKDVQGALELLADLQQQARDNSKHAGDVAVLLNTYSAKLITAEASLINTGKKIDADNKVNDDRIKVLQGGDDVTGSISNFNKLMEVNKKEYDHDVVVASTTPTYAWIFPFGTIAAAIMAGVYGAAAVKALAAYEEMKGRVLAANKELSIAISTQGIQNLANKGVQNVKEHTTLAITQTVVVQNMWAAVDGNLDAVKGFLEKMTSSTDAGEKLKSEGVIKYYAGEAGKKWAALLPSIEELTVNPYIQVDPTEMDSSALLLKIQAEMNSAASSN